MAKKKRTSPAPAARPADGFTGAITESWDTGSLMAYADWLQDRPDACEKQLGETIALAITDKKPPSYTQVQNMVRYALGDAATPDEVDAIASCIECDRGLPRKLVIVAEGEDDQLETLRKHLPELFRAFPHIDTLEIEGATGLLPEISAACHGLPIQPRIRDLHIDVPLDDGYTAINCDGDRDEGEFCDHRALLQSPLYRDMKHLHMMGFTTSRAELPHAWKKSLESFNVSYMNTLGGTDQEIFKYLAECPKLVKAAGINIMPNDTAHDADMRRVTQRVQHLGLSSAEMTVSDRIRYLRNALTDTPDLKTISLSIGFMYGLDRMFINDMGERKKTIIVEMGGMYLPMNAVQPWVENAAHTLEFSGEPILPSLAVTLARNPALQKVRLKMEINRTGATSMSVKAAEEAITKHNNDIDPKRGGPAG